MKIRYWLVGCMLWVALLTSQSTFAQNKLIDSLKLTLRKQLHDTTRANTLYDIANAFYKQNKFDSTTQYLKLMRSVCIRSRYVAGLGNYNRLQGAMHMRKGMFEDALAFDQAAITAFTKSGRLRLVGQVHHNMGWLYKVMGESQNVAAYTRQGLEHMHQSIAINQRLNSLRDLAENYVNLGILYEDLGEFKQGRECFFKALALGEEAHIDPDENRVIYNNLGRNFNAEGEYQQAIAYLNKSLPINLKLDRSSSLAHNYRNLATAYLGLKQPDKALIYAEKALVEVKRSKEVPLSRSVYGVLSKAYEAAGQYDKAYRSVLEQKRIEDTLMSLEKTRTITQLQGKYQLQQAHELAKIKAELELAKAQQIASIEANKAKEIAAIQREERHRLAQIKARADVEKARELAEIETKYQTQKRLEQIASLDKENQNRSQQIKLMTGGVGILVILVSILLGQYYVIRRANRRLSVQNEVITQHSRDLSSQSDQLRTLMKELHHRVKNNLAIVSSLLNLQVNSLHDEKAIQAVRIGQQRVEAMSLIHQQLYRTDQLTVINMDEYLTSLAESLIRAYGYDPATFKLQIDIEKQELDVDIAIPIGLIVNELITNAFKYAYLEQQEPLLRIALHGDNSPAPSGLVLEVQDNGPGIEVSDWRKPDSRPSFGKRLIMSLSQQLDGHFDLLNEKGTLFRLHIPTSRLVA